MLIIKTDNILKRLDAVSGLIQDIIQELQNTKGEVDSNDAISWLNEADDAVLDAMRSYSYKKEKEEDRNSH